MIEFVSDSGVPIWGGHYGQKSIILDIGNFTRAHKYRKHMITFSSGAEVTESTIGACYGQKI